MTDEQRKTKPETSTTIFELSCGATINYHRIASGAPPSPEFAEEVAVIELRLLDESVDSLWVH